MIFAQEASDTFREIKSSGVGYRNNDWSGGGNKTFLLNDVIYGELVSLHNSDILWYCNKTYGAGFDIEFESAMEADMDEEERIAVQQDCFANIAPEFVEEVEMFIKAQFKTDELYAVWLTSKEGVYSRYSDGMKELSAYRVPSDALIISDLGIDGILIVTSKNPEELMF